MNEYDELNTVIKLETKRDAIIFREIKKRCTYRRIAEIYLSEKDPVYGHQWVGEMLCLKVLDMLYPNQKIRNFDPSFGVEFIADNVSRWCIKEYDDWLLNGADLQDLGEIFFWWD